MKIIREIAVVVAVVLLAFVVYRAWHAKENRTTQVITDLRVKEHELLGEIEELEHALKESQTKRIADSLAFAVSERDSSIIKIYEERRKEAQQFLADHDDIILLPIDAKVRELSGYLNRKDSAAWDYLHRAASNQPR